MIGADGAYFVNGQRVRLGPDNQIFFDGPWSENKPSVLAYGSLDTPVMLPPFHVTASRIRDSLREFGAGLAKGLATGLIATIVSTVLVTAAPAAVPALIGLAGIASVNGLHDWAERGYPVTAPGTGELIGTMVGGGFSAGH
jgi:hypothetical protein